MTNPVQKVKRPESCTVALNNGIDEHRLPERATIYIDLMKREIAGLKSKLEAANRDNQNLKLAIGLSCEFHGCGSSECSPKSYLDDARALISKVGKLESELAKQKESQL